MSRSSVDMMRVDLLFADYFITTLVLSVHRCYTGATQRSVNKQKSGYKKSN